ncbi:hypothetical protein J2127_001051 [Methanococcus voltae]|nr:hypothetical protein [Methanococcus voltae]
MERAINSILKLVRTNNQKIYITGHSLGGAQALLSAFVCDSLKDFERITTFGQPRVGDKNFAKWVTEKIQNDAKNKSKYFRVVNKYDPVANLPYWGYYHCNNFYLSCNEGENYTCKDGEFKRPFGGTTESMVEDIKAVNSESMVEDIKAVNSESMVEDIVAIKFNLFANHYMELYLKNAFRNINYDPFHR